jgi:hypothetical protein
MRLAIHKEDQHDLTDSSRVSIDFSPQDSVFIPQMALAVCKI